MRKCPAGVGCKIFLEGRRFALIRKGTIPGQFPGFEFGRVSRFSGVVLWNAALQIRSGADVFLFGKINAADDVDVPHRPFTFRLGRAASCRTLDKIISKLGD